MSCFFILVQFLDEDVAPADFATMGLQLDWAVGNQWFAVRLGCFAVPEISEGRIVHDEFAVKLDGNLVAYHFDVESIPLAKRLVGQHERVATGRAGRAVVPKTSGALVRADLPYAAFLGSVPNLDLWNAAQVNAAVGLGDGFVVHVQLEVAVVLYGTKVQAIPVID